MAIVRAYGTRTLQAPYNYHKFIEMSSFLSLHKEIFIFKSRLFQSKNVVSFTTSEQTLLEWILFTTKLINIHGTIGILWVLNLGLKGLPCQSLQKAGTYILGICLSTSFTLTGLHLDFYKDFKQSR